MSSSKDIRVEKLSRQVLKGMTTERLSKLLLKDSTIQMRVSEADKVDMQRTAKSLNLTLTEYLTRCHLIISERLQKAR